MPELQCLEEPDTDLDGDPHILLTEHEEQALEVIIKMIVHSGQSCCPTHLTMHLFDYVDERVVEQIETGGGIQ